MKPVIRWTLWQRRWSVFWWVVGLTALIVITLIFYPTIRNQTGQLDKTFNQIPQTAKALFTDTQNIFSPVGYLSSQLFYLMLPMLLSVLAIGMGSSLVARDEADGTLELLLARPLSRGRLLLSKAVAGAIILAIVGAVALLVTLLMCAWVNMRVSLADITLAGLYSIVLALVFGAIAFLVAALGRTARLASIGVAALIAIAGYIVASLASVVSWLAWPAKLFAYHYYHPGEILQGQGSLKPLFCFLAVTAALYLCAWWAFARRDIG